VPEVESRHFQLNQGQFRIERLADTTGNSGHAPQFAILSGATSAREICMLGCQNAIKMAHAPARHLSSAYSVGQCYDRKVLAI
jgi:hypothetical protein